MPDVAALAALHSACFTLPRPWSAAEIGSLLDSPHCFVLTESGGFLIGRAVAGEAELLTVAVAPDQRRTGIAARLVHGFLTEAQRRGATHAFLEVAAGNTAARALYDRSGFVAAGLRKGYYCGTDGQRDDALILTRAVETAG